MQILPLILATIAGTVAALFTVEVNKLVLATQIDSLLNHEAYGIKESLLLRAV